MKKVSIIFVSAISLFLTACGQVPPGHVGIRVNTLGMDRGVEQHVLDVGWFWLGLWQHLYTFPIFAQNHVWDMEKSRSSPDDESLTFQDVDGTKCNADVGIQYTLIKDKVPTLFVTYRKQIEEITHIVLHNLVRDKLIKHASKMHVSEIYGAGKADLLNAVEKEMRDDMIPVGINIDRLYWTSDIRIPDAIRESLNAKIRANQIAEQKQNELVQVKADAAKVVAEAEGKKQAAIKEAEGIATANKMINDSLTPNLIIYEQVKRWNGVSPMIGTSIAPPTLMMNPNDFKPVQPK